MKERRGGGNETEQSFAISFCTYIHLYLYISHFALIFLTKNCTVFTIGIVFYISFIRIFIAHFPTVNRSFVPLPFLSYSSSSPPSLLFPFFHYGANFLFFRIENDRHGKNERESCVR